VQWASAAALERLDAMTAGNAILGPDAPTAALKQLAGLVRREALVMSFADVFYLLTFLFVALVVFTPLLRRATQEGGGAH